MKLSNFGSAILGAALLMSAQMALDTYRAKRGPWDAVVDHTPVCAASKQDTGSRIVLDGVLRGPCNSTDVGRKP